MLTTMDTTMAYAHVACEATREALIVGESHPFLQTHRHRARLLMQAGLHYNEDISIPEVGSDSLDVRLRAIREMSKAVHKPAEFTCWLRAYWLA